MNEHSGWLGEYRVTIIRPSGSETINLKNHITNAGLNMIRDGWLGIAKDLQLKYLAFGDSDKPVQDDQTKLDNERFRIAFANQVPEFIGKAKSLVFLPDDQALFHIREIGVFAGKSASNDINSGVMVSRMLFDFDKSNPSEPLSLKFERIDTLRRL